MNGFINLFKPIDMTSNDAVVKARGILKRALGEKLKVGHLGTLDPLATGVLPIAIGKATRLFDYSQQKRKVYIAEFRFGATTDTLDGGGKLLSSGSYVPSIDEILQVLPRFTGEIEQIPPQYSAKSVGGKRAYDIAREGGHVELAPKKVSIYSIELLGQVAEDIFKLKIECSGGTYIRALARDVAQAAGTIGYMSSLCRTMCGPFALDDSVTFEYFEKDPLKFVLPMDVLLNSFDVVTLDDVAANKALNGIKIPYESTSSPFAVKHGDDYIAMGEVKDGYLRLRTRL